MQKDFHFYAVAVLARAVGFSAKDSVTIAYSSQYVDDATESKPIQVGDSFFDPARTAHFGIFSFDWDVQKLIFIPFHFLPAKKDFLERGSFVTEADSELAEYVLQQAIDDTSDIHLHRIGIALHTFADTWAHRGFSGRHNSENNVSTIKIKKKSKFRNELIKNIYLDLLPQIGHCEAGYCPDIPYLHWKCQIDNRQHESNNVVSFLDAAAKIYQRLSRIRKQSVVKSWEELEKDFTTLFACDEENIEKRCVNWQKRFDTLFTKGAYQYSPNLWRKKAFGVANDKDVEWDKFSMDKMSKLKYAGSPSFSDSDWVKFHKAARMQRAEIIT